MGVPGRWLRWVAAGITILTVAATSVAPANAGGAPDAVAYVGDSIGRDAEPQTRALVEPEHEFGYFEAVAAGNVPYHHPLLLTAVSAAADLDVVIVELGTGDAFFETTEAVFEANARALLDDITPLVDCIRWLDIKEGGTQAYPTVNRFAAGINRAIHRVVADYPTVEYMHYEAWTRMAGDTYFWPDLLHHNAAGRVEMGRIVNQAVDGCDPALTSGPFWDVRDDYWAAGDIAWMASAGIANGYPNGTYRALVGSIEPTVSRGQMANFLWRVAGSPTGYADHPWTDGPAWIDSALDWLADTGIANGYPDGTYRPEVTVGRGEVANFLWRVAGSPTGYVDHPWTDGPAWIDDALDWLADTGIANGYPDGTYRPGSPLSRAAMAHLLHGYALLPPAAPPTTTDDTEPPTQPGAPPPTPTPPAPVPNPTTTTTPPTTFPPATVPATTTTTSPAG